MFGMFGAMMRPGPVVNDVPFPGLGSKLVAFYDMNNAASLWQDASGTVPVTAYGQTVRRADDASGNGHHLTFSAAQPWRAGWRTGTGCVQHAYSATATSSVPLQSRNMRLFLVFQDHGMASRINSVLLLNAFDNVKPFGFRFSNDSNTVLSQWNPSVTALTRAQFQHVGYPSLFQWRLRSDRQTVSNELYSHDMFVIPDVGTYPLTGFPQFENCQLDLHRAVWTTDDLTEDEETALLAYLRQPLTTPDGDINFGFVGDSLSIGFTSETGNTWPRRFLDLHPSVYYPHTLIAAPGVRLINVSTAIPNFNASAARNVMTIWLGANDLIASATSANMISWLSAYIDARVAEGWEVFVLDIPPSGSSYPVDADRIAFNAWIAANEATHNYTGVPVAATLNDPTSAFFNADQLHLSDAGDAVVAAAVDAAVFP